MKRALVDYASSDEDETPAKKRLPRLSASLTVPTPVDNPALHQGRVRAVPHIEGQYATYIYVPLVVHQRDALYQLVEDAVTLARTHVPSLHSIGRHEHDSAAQELHISLSRPLFLRAHQRDEFKGAIRQMASSIAPFEASFTTFSELTNDERTRTFLALDIGAGHGELRHCLDLLGPSLRSLRQKEFYVDPKFHSSIAWALLNKIPSPPSHSVACATAEEQRLSNNFHGIAHFPHSLVPSLNEAYAAKLSQARTGGFVVDRISVKIGKDIFTWPLNGIK